MASNTDNSDGVKRVRKRKPAAASGSPGGKRKAQRITTASEEIVVSST